MTLYTTWVDTQPHFVENHGVLWIVFYSLDWGPNLCIDLWGFLHENWHRITPIEGTINPNFNNYPYLERPILASFCKSQKKKRFLHLHFYGDIFFTYTHFFANTCVYHGQYSRFSHGDLKSFTDKDLKFSTLWTKKGLTRTTQIGKTLNSRWWEQRLVEWIRRGSRIKNKNWEGDPPIDCGGVRLLYDQP